MAVRTTAGSTLRITATAPATFDESGYNTLFTGSPLPALVGEITDFGEFGREYNLVTHNPVADRGTVKLKGSFNEGQMAMTLGLDTDDAGQILMKTARDSDDDYYFMVTEQKGDRYFFAAKVMTFKQVLGNVDSVTQANATLELTTTNGVGIVESLV